MDIYVIASWVGGIAFALSGLLLGIRKELDIMGLFIVAMLTANGGGAIRDVLVGKTPTVLYDTMAFYLVFCVVVGGVLLRIQRHPGLERRWLFVISDSAGLIAFSITGAMVALDSHLTIFGVLVLAFITATGGGILRDILVNEVPSVLSGGFYGSVALLVAFAIYAIDQYSLAFDVWVPIIFVLGFMIRLAAFHYNWHLPRIRKGRPYLGGNE